MSTTIRVSEGTRQRLSAISSATGRPMTQILDEAVEALERRIFFQDLNARFEELRRDPRAWAEIEAERREWETTLRDASR